MHRARRNTAEATTTERDPDLDGLPDLPRPVIVYCSAESPTFARHQMINYARAALAGRTPEEFQPPTDEAIIDAVLLGLYYDGCGMTRESEPDEAAWLARSRRNYPEHVDDARAVVRRLRAIGRPADGIR